MLEEFQEQERKRMIRMRSIMDYAMGTILIVAGGLLLAFSVGNLADLNRKLLGGLFILYGAWRLYRAYKKAYYR